ncbi:hypothetical protein [Flavobacterium lacisediminis]|uniref:Uncharacterized protein n=1 Tax=Flavobacterium lacisediminis TaxID=2989705 RepID=A0ABT3EKQ8_9FLAO|nr:hypothetical protein [Flavobacterium lacisediminis]MCW1149164.1 hypothetical protein [Flavobacterium lacisediminis]
MKTRFFTLAFVLFTIISFGQNQLKATNTVQQKQISENAIYQLFPTDNYWTFIKLDTRNGKMWQVHFTISDDGYQGELILNSSSLLMSDEVEVKGRFTLYKTNNMYNFILLDQINGKTYQVQWNSDKEKRFVSRI